MGSSENTARTNEYSRSGKFVLLTVVLFAFAFRQDKREGSRAVPSSVGEGQLDKNKAREPACT